MLGLSEHQRSRLSTPALFTLNPEGFYLHFSGACRSPPMFMGALEECEQQAGYPQFKQHNLISAAEQGDTHTHSICLSQAFGVFYLR